MSKMVRVNTNISTDINEWLNARSERTGISKSALILLALDQYRNQVDVLQELPKITQMMEMIHSMQQRNALSSEALIDSEQHI